jgi:hypothetical protein
LQNLVVDPPETEAERREMKINEVGSLNIVKPPSSPSP